MGEKEKGADAANFGDYTRDEQYNGNRNWGIEFVLATLKNFSWQR
jgi:hypothetical protein